MTQNKFSLDELVVAMQPIFDEYADLRIEKGIYFAKRLCRQDRRIETIYHGVEKRAYYSKFGDVFRNSV